MSVDKKMQPSGDEFTRADFLKRSVVAGVGLAGLPAFLAACGGAQSSEAAQANKSVVPDQLIMGIIPAEDNAEMLRQFKPVIDYLNKDLGTNIKTFTATDYSGIIEAMRSKKVDIGWFGPLSYVLAATVGDAEAIAAPLKKGQKEPTYHSVMVTRPETGIKSIKDLKGKTFAFVDPASTSGHLFPLKAFKDAGIDPDKDLKKTTYAGGHDAVELAVKNGTVDAGADDDSTYDKMTKSGAISKDQNVVFWKSKPIPGSPIAVRGDLPKKLKQKIQDSFLSMTADKLGGPIAYDEAVKYVKVSNKNYQGIRNLVDTLGLDLKKLANE